MVASNDIKQSPNINIIDKSKSESSFSNTANSNKTVVIRIPPLTSKSIPNLSKQECPTSINEPPFEPKSISDRYEKAKVKPDNINLRDLIRPPKENQFKTEDTLKIYPLNIKQTKEIKEITNAEILQKLMELENKIEQNKIELSKQIIQSEEALSKKLDKVMDLLLSRR